MKWKADSDSRKDRELYEKQKLREQFEDNDSDAFENNRMSGWVSVERKLPPEPAGVFRRKAYLTWTEGGVEICFYLGRNSWSSEAHEMQGVKVTHWLEGPK